MILFQAEAITELLLKLISLEDLWRYSDTKGVKGKVNGLCHDDCEFTLSGGQIDFIKF